MKNHNEVLRIAVRPGAIALRIWLVIANTYGVPNFTITNTGMYVYDPATRRTSKVFDDLDWLKPANLPRWAEAMAQHAGHYSVQAPLACSEEERVQLH